MNCQGFFLNLAFTPPEGGGAERQTLKKKHDFFEEQRRAKKLGSSMIFESWIFAGSSNLL
jgi:hypothetical protein